MSGRLLLSTTLHKLQVQRLLTYMAWNKKSLSNFLCNGLRAIIVIKKSYGKEMEYRDGMKVKYWDGGSTQCMQHVGGEAVQDIPKAVYYTV